LFYLTKCFSITLTLAEAMNSHVFQKIKSPEVDASEDLNFYLDT